MKKIKSMIFLTIFLLQNILCAIPVFALESVEDKIEFVSIKQNELELVSNDAVYNITNFDDKITLSFKVDVSDETKNYGVMVYKDNSMYSMIPISNIGEYSYNEFKLDPSKNMTNYEFVLCEREMHNCKEELDSKELNFSYDNSFYGGNIYFTDYIQDGVSVIPEEVDGRYKFIINPLKDVTIKIKGENLIDNVYYSLLKNTDMEHTPLKYTGSELESGVQINIDTQNDQILSYMYGYELFGLDIVKYKYNDNYYNSMYQFYEESEVETFTTDLIYTNYQDAKLNKYDHWELEGLSYYVVDNSYHNVDNSLSLNLFGKYYSDKYYDMNIKVYYDNELIYEKDDKVIGEDLEVTEEGFKYELNDLKLKSLDNFDNLNLYHVVVTIDDYQQDLYFKYNVGGKQFRINDSLFYGNGEKTINSHAGWITSYGNGSDYIVNTEALSSYSMYINYLGEEFDDNKEYSYVLEYSDSFDVDGNASLLETGKITGSLLNSKGLLFNIVNKEEYITPEYRLIIKDGNNIVYCNNTSLFVTNNPVITKLELFANKSLYMQKDNYNYLAVTNVPISVTVSGISFIDEKLYEVEVQECDYNLDNVSLGCKTKKAEVFGREINSGNLKLELDKVSLGAVNKYVSILIYGEDKTIALTDDGINIDYVNSSAYFTSNIPYNVEEDIIKNIKKNTNIEDFNDFEIIKNGGKVVFYDKDGNSVSSKYIGTGMIARVVDSNDRNLFDLDVVVTGDVTGDGEISITDLVKVKRHVEELDTLKGLYEVAGDIIVTGKVDRRDFSLISEDLAGINEVK